MNSIKVESIEPDLANTGVNLILRAAHNGTQYCLHLSPADVEAIDDADDAAARHAAARIRESMEKSEATPDMVPDGEENTEGEEPPLNTECFTGGAEDDLPGDAGP